MKIMFQPISLSSKSIFEKYLRAANKQCCDYAFANLFAWSKYYQTVWCEFENFLIIRFHVAGSEKWAYLEPLGTGDATAAIQFIFRDAANETKQPVRFFSISQEFVNRYQALPEMQTQRFYTDRSFGNYIYSREKLAHLAGRKLHSKRNHITQFDKRYPTAKFEILNPEKHAAALHKLITKWCQTQEVETTTIRHEKEMIENSLAHYAELNLFGILLSVDENAIAFSFGSQINQNTFCVHVEKADTQYEGAYAKINQLMAENLPAEIEWINREEDMGLSSLRKSKLSYFPDAISAEYFSTSKNSTENDIWELWQKAFPEDSDEFLATFIYPYSNPSTQITHYENGKLASMLHLISFSSKWGKVAYIYGLATDPEFSGKGFAKKVIFNAMQRAKENGCTCICAIQANLQFTAWQTQFDFTPPSVTIQFQTEDGFDFGGEEEDIHRGIFRILDVQTFLQKFAATHSDSTEKISVNDSIFLENTGVYSLQNGKTSKISNLPEKSIQTINAFFQNNVENEKLGMRS